MRAGLVAVTVGAVCLVLPLAGFGRIGDYSDHQVMPAGLRIEAGNDTLYLTIYAADIARLDFRPEGSGPPGTDLIVTKCPDPDVEFEVHHTIPALALHNACGL